MKKLAWSLVVASLFGATHATTFSLVDQNSVITGDTTNQLDGWVVDGVNHLASQAYFFRIGMTPEQNVAALGSPVVTQTLPNALNLRYANGQVRWDATYVLTGGAAGSQASVLTETVRIINLTNQPMAFTMFEYDDFDLNGTALGDTATVIGPTTIQQTEVLSVAVVGTTPAFDRWEIDFAPATLTKLTDGNVDDLANATAPSGPGNVAFANQWNFTIGGGRTVIMSKSKAITVVPEPTTLVALAVGAAALLRRRKS